MTVSNTSLDLHHADLKGVGLVENTLDSIKSNLSLIQYMRNTIHSSSHCPKDD